MVKQGEFRGSQSIPWSRRGNHEQPVAPSASFGPGGPRRRNVDASLVLSLDHKCLAGGSHAPGAVLWAADARCHSDQDRQGPCPHEAVTIITLERLFWTELSYKEAQSWVRL